MRTSQQVTEWEPRFEEFTLHGFLDGSFRLVELVRDDAVCRAVLRRERPPGKLSGRERCVIERLIGGSSQKTVSFDLGVALTTVSVHLRVALDKLGIRRWEHAVLAGAIIMAGGATAVENGWGGTLGTDEQLAIAKVELFPKALSELTLAEREVTLLVVDGLTNAEIGVQRNSSPRTVANQIAAVFRKLGVHGRLELILRLALGVGASREPEPREHPVVETAPPLLSVADIPPALPLIARPAAWTELTSPAS
jgi:DNA-binding NarL/FixJ family response regulator